MYSLFVRLGDGQFLFIESRKVLKRLYNSYGNLTPFGRANMSFGIRKAMLLACQLQVARRIGLPVRSRLPSRVKLAYRNMAFLNPHQLQGTSALRPSGQNIATPRDLFSRKFVVSRLWSPYDAPAGDPTQSL
jgi:hypothetical protein